MHGSKEKEQDIKLAGSGVFVAPQFCLGAKHVSASFETYDDQFDALYRRRSVLDDPYVMRTVERTKFSTMLYQVQPSREPIEWACAVDWASPDTDITTMQVVPRTPGADATGKAMRFFDWQMLPPPVGGQVRIIGLPAEKITNDGRDHDIQLAIHSEPATVVEVCPVRRECGMWKYPGFRLDIELEHGMSGAPVFYDGALVGIFSGPDYVASLWPRRFTHTAMLTATPIRWRTDSIPARSRYGTGQPSKAGSSGSRAPRLRRRVMTTSRARRAM